MLGYLVRIIQLTIFILVAACLPQEKTTQCGSGEAYNATQRRCVATAVSSTKSITITNVSPTSSYAVSASEPSTTHSIVVSDPFNLGYTMKWNLKQPNGTELLVGTGLSYTFIHTAFSTGVYILEAQVFDSSGSTFLDSRSWTINFSSDTIPSINPTTPNPIATTTTSADVPITAVLSNPNSIPNVNYTWYVNGSKYGNDGVTLIENGTSNGIFSNTSETTTLSFDPTSGSGYHSGAGTYAVQLVLDDGNGVQYDSFTWTVQNNIPGFTTVSLGPDMYTNTTPAPSALLTIIDELDFDPAIGGIRYNHNNITAGELQEADVCITVAEFAGVDGDGVAVDFLMNGAAIPNANALTYTSDGQTICLGASIAAASGSYNINIPSTVQVESRTITAVVYDKYPGITSQPSYNGGAEIARYNWTARVRQKNAAPIVTIDYETVNDADETDMDVSGLYGYDCSSKSATAFSGCEVKQDNQLVVVVDISDDADGDGVQDYDITASPSQFQVEFFIDNMDIDGNTGNISSAAKARIVDEDCTYEYLDGTSAANRMKCTLEINSYDENGPVTASAQNYQIAARAKVNALAGYGGVGESAYSNEVTWSINTVNDANDTIDLIPFVGGVINTDSTIVDGSSPLTVVSNTGSTMAENDVVNFNVIVNDPQHDSHTIKLYRCNDGTTCGSYTLVATKLVNSTAGTFDYTTHNAETVIAYQISQDAVNANNISATGDADVYYRVFVEGVTGATTEADDVTTNGGADAHPYIEIDNYNPDPTTAKNFNPAQNTIATPLVAYAGFPITIDAGTITDTSLADGENITYQWMIAVDSDNDGATNDETFEAIEGATSKNLVWSPGPEIDVNTNSGNNTGTLVDIKLCIGDDGYMNGTNIAKNPTNGGGTNCLNGGDLDTSTTGNSWYFHVYSNMYVGQAWGDNNTANTSSGEVALWIDPSTTNPIVKYMAYVNQNKEIVIEKFVTTTTTGEKGGSVEQTVEEISNITFPASTDAFFGANDVTHLSIAGDTTNDALYVAYMAPVSGVDIAHVRRIDIRSGKTGYDHQATFGWDKGYDDLTDNFTPGPGLSESVNTNGQLEITVTQDADSQPLISLSMNAATGGSTTLSKALGDFCSGSCSTTTQTATEIANAINAATGEGFQGMTASASGAVVTLDGVYEEDYIQQDIGASALGQIMISKSGTTAEWIVPFIDSDQSGNDKFKLSAWRGELNTRLANITPTITFLNGGTNIKQASEIVNDILEEDPDGDGVNTTNVGGDRILIAIRSMDNTNTDGEVAIYEFDENLNLIERNDDVFTDNDITDLRLKVSQNTTNLSAYLMGRNSSDAFAYARFDRPSTSENFDLSTGGAKVVVNMDNAYSLFTSNNVTNYDIAPGANQYQLFMATVDAGNTTAYLNTITGDTPVIDCSYSNDQNLANCMKLTANWATANTVDTVFEMPVALGRVMEDITIGNAGATTGENINDVLPVVYQINDGGGLSTTDALPITGLLNVTPISVSGDSGDMGQVHALPYVND